MARTETSPDRLPITQDNVEDQGSGSALKTRSGLVQRFLQHNATKVDKNWSTVPVLATSFVSGLTDSASYNAWSCFISMQTGNTVFVGLGASGQPASKPMGWLSSLISIAFFIIGVATIAFFSRHAGPTKRGTLTISFLVQALFIVIAAAMVEARLVPIATMAEQETGKTPFHFISLLPLAFLAFQAGGQIVVSRGFGHNHIPSVVLTSLYSDLVSDPMFWVPKNVKRNERIASAVLILAGAITGGWIMKVASMASVLWFAAGIKLVIVAGWMFWPAEKEE